MQNDFIDLNKKTWKDDLRKSIDKLEKEARDKGIPFCSRCYKTDFEDEISLRIKEFERKGIIPQTINIPNLNFKDYTDKRFDKISEQPAYESVLVGTVRQTQLIGTHINYKCRVRDCGVSVFKSVKNIVQQAKDKIEE